MSFYGTSANYLRSYGGRVAPTEATVSDNGALVVSFNRKIVYPLSLIQKYDPFYREEVPALTPTDEEKENIQKDYEAQKEQYEVA